MMDLCCHMSDRDDAFRGSIFSYGFFPFALFNSQALLRETCSVTQVQQQQPRLSILSVVSSLSLVLVVVLAQGPGDSKGGSDP